MQQQIILPAVAAIVSSFMVLLISGSVPVAIGVAFGCAFGLWLAQKRKQKQ